MDIEQFDNYEDLINVLEVLPAAVVLAEIETRLIAYVNPAFCDLSGYRKDEIIGRPQTELHPVVEVQGDSFAEHIDILKSDQQPETLPQKLLCKDHSAIAVQISANWLEVSGKKYLLGFFNSVQEKVELLERLSFKEQELDAIFQNSTVGIMMLTGYRLLHRCNQRLADIFGYATPDEMIGISMRELHLSEENFKEFGRRYYETLRHRENLQIEYPVKKKNGELVWIVISGKAIDDNNPADLSKGVIWVLDDISVRKNLEQLIVDETERYKSLLAFSADAVLILSPEDGSVLECSNMACELLGYSNEEILNLKVIDWDKSIDIAGYQAVVDGLSQVPKIIERIHTRKDGSQYIASISARLIDFGSGPIIHTTMRDVTQQKELEAKVKQERNLFRGGATVVFNWDPVEGWLVKSVSHNVDQVMGYSVAEVTAQDFVFSKRIHPSDLPRVMAEVEDYLGIHAAEFEQSYRFKVASGEYRNFYVYTRVDYNERGVPVSIYGYMIDLTEYLKHQHLSKILLENTSEGILGINADGITTFANPASLRMLGYTEKELVERENHTLIHHSDEHGTLRHQHDCNMMRPLKTGEDIYVYDEVLWRKDGTHFPVEYRSTPVVEDGLITSVVVSFHDITEHKEQEEVISRLAYLDSLTDLPNRRFFNKTLAEKLDNLAYSQRKLVLIMLDLDHFKDVNDSLGHPVGDVLLIGFAKRIKKILREDDFFARLGGDEFAILSKVNQLEDAEIITQKIIKVMQKPFEVELHSILTNVSIGVAAVDETISADKLICNADIALYRSKLNGRGQYCFYEEGMSANVKAELNLVSQLTHAVERNEFELAFQPQIDVVTNKVVGIETLIRWHPSGEVEQASTVPTVFIALAEKRGLINSITRWSIQELIATARKLKGIYSGRMSLNMSAELLNELKTIDALMQPLISHSIEEIQFDIEITETAFVNLSMEVVEYLNGLSDHGISLSIDDFGTGYSSLSMLRNLNSSYVKIDKEFIDEVNVNDDDYAIVAATISMAHNLGKKVIAEGVETQAQVACLKYLDCDVIQGYYYAKPMFMEELIPFLETSH